MIFRRVTNLTETEEQNGWQTTNASTRRHTEEDEEGCVEDMHIESSVPVDLLRTQEVEESPEVFKRVRFITRWEDLEESKGSLMLSIGGLHYWRVAHNSPATMPRRQILNTLHENFLREGDFIFKDVSGSHRFYYHLSFFGADLQRSKPIILIYCEERRLRQRAMKVAKELPWLTPNSRILLASCSGANFKGPIESSRRRTFIYERKKF